jgi:periplasmic protein TonB
MDPQKNKSQVLALARPLLSATVLMLTLTLFSSKVNGQNKTIQMTNDPNRVYQNVDKEPDYPGGIREFYTYLSKTIKYPAEARKKKIQGKVFIQFIVEKDGTLTGIRAIRGPGHGINEEAVRAVRLSAKWKPGTESGKVVRVQFTIPVNFTLAAPIN